MKILGKFFKIDAVVKRESHENHIWESNLEKGEIIMEVWKMAKQKNQTRLQTEQKISLWSRNNQKVKIMFLGMLRETDFILQFFSA